MMANMMNIQLQLQNKKIQLENIELQYKNNGFVSDLGTVNTSFEIIDIGLELLKSGMGMNLNQISNQIFQFQMKLQSIILKLQNLGMQNKNVGMNPFINNNIFFNNELGNVINSNNEKKINVYFKALNGLSINIISNYKTPINEVIEKFFNKVSIPIEKRKRINFVLSGCIIRKNDNTSIGNYCFKDNNNLTIIVNDSDNLIGGKE